jgi:hypothetical protein
MPRYLTIAFTGNTVLTPDYPDNLWPIDGPLSAVLPGARHRRPSTLGTQIDSQLAFMTFRYRHLLIDAYNSRDADYKYPGTRRVTAGLCFLEREHLELVTRPIERQLTFDPSPITCAPAIGSTGALWIARWHDFAVEGQASIRPQVFVDQGDHVRLDIPAGHISAAFVSEPIARVDFDYGYYKKVRPYAQEIVVTLTFDDSVPYVEFLSWPFVEGTGLPPAEPSSLKFKWCDASTMKIIVGNGSLASIESVLRSSFAGHDHEGDFDVEFEVTYDVVNCEPDYYGVKPLPLITNHEILRVPCIASMVAAAPVVAEAKEAAPPVQIVTDLQRVPRSSRRRSKQ